MRTRKCPYCGYEWRPRKASPKSCPYCKRYFKQRKLGRSKSRTEPIYKEGAEEKISQILIEEQKKLRKAEKSKEPPSVLILSQEEEPDENQRLEEGRKVKIRRPLSVILH